MKRWKAYVIMKTRKTRRVISRPMKRIPVRSKFRGKYKSRWCPYLDGVSATGLSRFRSCLEQMRLYYVEGWRLRDELASRIGLNFGNVCHDTLEHAYAYKKGKKPPDLSWLQKHLANYEKLILIKTEKRQGRVSEKGRVNLALVCGLAEATLPIYFKRYAGDWPLDKYPNGCKPTIARPAKWKAFEKTFRVHIKLPNGKRIPIIGKRDAWFEDSRGDAWIMDTKCLSVINDTNIVDTLGHNLQQMLYCWAFWKETGICPAGCVLNIIRRSTMYRRKDEGLCDYFARIHNEVSKRQNWQHFFKRIPHSLTGSCQLKTWEQTVLVPLLTHLCQWWEGKSPHYMNDDALVTKYGRCDLYEPIVHGNFLNFRQTRTRTGSELLA